MNINKLLFWCVTAILFLPIIVLPPTFQPSDWTRTILFRVILTGLIAYIAFRFFYKKNISLFIPKKNNLVFLPVYILSAFFLILVLSAAFSQDIRFSIFGSPTRAGGILTYLFYIIFAVILAIFVKEGEWKKLWTAAFTAGILASLLAIVQYFNLLKSVFVAYEGGGTPSLLGNSTFLAIYIFFLSLLAFTLFTQEADKKKKMIYIGLFVLFAVTILITGSRATYLAMVISLATFFFFYPKKFKKIKVAAVLVLVAAMLIVLVFNVFGAQLSKNNILANITNRLSLTTIAKDLLGTRFSTWKITLQEIKDKPILGWGPENFYIGFEKYYDPTIPDFQGLWWDRPHNIFLETFVNSGIFALVLYIAFWAVLLWQLQRFKRAQGDKRETYLAHGLQAMFLGYLIVLFFNFDSFSTYLISFFFVGYAFYLLSLGEKQTFLPKQKSFFGTKFAGAIYLIALLFLVWIWGLKPLYINEETAYAKKLASSGKCSQATNTMDSAWKNSGNILKAYASLKYADVLQVCSASQPDKEADFAAKGVQAMKQASLFQPQNTRTWLFMGAFTNVSAAREQNESNRAKLLSDGIEYLKKAREISPGRQEVLIEMEKNYLISKNYQAMINLANECVKINPNRGECYWYMGIAEIFSGDVKNGKSHVEKSLAINGFSPAYIQLGVAYMNQKDYPDAAEAYSKLVDIYPNNASYHATLAFLYRQIGNFKRAGEEATAVFKIQPNNPETMSFLQALLGLSPNEPTLHGSLAYIYTQMGETDKAKQELKIAKSLYLNLIANNPNFADYHFKLAGVYRELRDYDNAYKEALLTAKLDLKTYGKGVEAIMKMLPGRDIDYQKYLESLPK